MKFTEDKDTGSHATIEGEQIFWQLSVEGNDFAFLLLPIFSGASLAGKCEAYRCRVSGAGFWGVASMLPGPNRLFSFLFFSPGGSTRRSGTCQCQTDRQADNVRLPPDCSFNTNCFLMHARPRPLASFFFAFHKKKNKQQKMGPEEEKKLIDIFGEQTFRPILYANQQDTHTHTHPHTIARACQLAGFPLTGQ